MGHIASLHLRTLHAIARLGTFQAAAGRLNTTQPAISARMRELENQLGMALFQREGRRMMLTARARQLVTETEPLLAQLDQAVLRAADTAFASGIVRIGTGEIAAASCVPAFVRRTRQGFPNAILEIEVDLTAKMLASLLAGASDIVFLAGPIAHPGIVTQSMGSLETLWLASPEVGAAVQEGRAQPFWSLPAHSPLHHIARDAIARDGLAYASLNSCNNVRSLIEIVAQGGGVGLFPETMVRAELDRGTLIELFDRPPETIEFQAAVRRSEVDPLILSLFELASGLRIDPRP